MATPPGRDPLSFREPEEKAARWAGCWSPKGSAFPKYPEPENLRIEGSERGRGRFSDLAPSNQRIFA